MHRMIRRLLIGLGAALALTALTYLAGPVHALDTRDTPIDLPRENEALERWLEASEQRYGDVVEGAEKHIRWAHEDRRRTPLSIIYLHGYTATRQEVDPLCEELGEALGANVFYTRLTGHGRNPLAMGMVRGSDWLRDAREALEIGRLIGERVIVVGTSTGGTLALWLAQRGDASAIAAQVLISPNLGPRSPSGELLAGPWGAQLLQGLVGDEYRWTPHNAEQAKYWTWKYPSQALLPMMAIVREVRDSPIESIRQPTLVIYSPNDRVVSAEKILEAHERLGASIKPIIAVDTSGDPSNHVLAGRILAPDDTPRIRDGILAFAREIGLSTGSTTASDATATGTP
jgi:esterase/lipase